MIVSTFWISASTSFRCSALSNAIFWIASLVGLYADHLVETKKSPFLTKCKIQNDVFISGNDLRDLILLASLNMLFVSIFLCCPMYEFLWDQLHSSNRLVDSDEWIWQQELLLKLPVHLLVADLGFYLIHCKLHYSPWLYKHIHKIHHRFPAPTAMASVYAHPVEFCLGNLLPIYMGPILTNAHPKTCYIWWCMSILGTCKGHSGYRILGHADYHEEHHYYYKHNYGGMYVSDFLFGTLATNKGLYYGKKRS
jgi:sterol desaturase/sphingolipid hydroxylase (fatty acid hydroxylase superfamily)